ncbi:MAG: hypothetical protein CMJ34_01240 [Phycisphaerae bacterium]|nr:hypothetical protein [Phycisphaerae bacterium]
MTADPDSSHIDPQDARERLRADLESRADRWLGGEASSFPDDDSSIDGFVTWLLRSGRLAALGEDRMLASWPRVASVLGIDVPQALADAALAGIRRIESLDGVVLAESIAEAEDASCLELMEGRTTDLLGTTLAGRWLRSWSDAVSHVPLDEDGLAFLDERRRLWPLPDEMRLPVVETPLGEIDLIAGAAASMPARRLVPQFVHEEEAALFDDGRPTPGMIRRFATRRGAGATGSGRWLRADAELDPYWQVSLGLQAPGVGVRMVRIGPVRMELHPDSAGPGEDEEASMLWTASLSDLPLDVRTRVVCGDISIVTDEGDRFLL